MIAMTPESLLRAYAVGLFPMAEGRHDPRLYWIDPDTRGVIPLDEFHVPKRLARTVRQDRFQVTVNSAFGDVIRACAAPDHGRDATWINSQIIALYEALHRMGNAHSIECWLEGCVVGGLYGVSIGGAFFGESMFSDVTDSSKVALVHLFARLWRGGYRLLDTQFLTDHLKRFGAIEVSRATYQRMLTEALAVDADFYSLPVAPAGEEVLQSITQTS